MQIPSDITFAHPPHLTLIGTVHGDPHGFETLLKFLRAERPDLVTVEYTPFGWAYRRRNTGDLLRLLNIRARTLAERLGGKAHDTLAHPSIHAIRRQLVHPFEYRAAIRYAAGHGTDVLLVDDSQSSRDAIRHWPELLSFGNLEGLLAMTISMRTAEGEYRRAARELEAENPRAPEPKAPVLSAATDRKTFIARRILAACEVCKPENAIHICGWNHLLTGTAANPTLFDRLRAFRPRRLLLRPPA